MNVVPSIDLKGGRSVKLVKGIPGTGIRVSDNPIELAAYWEEQGAKALHVIDLDGALQEEETNRGIIEAIIREVSIPVQVGGGVRSEEAARELLDFGARWIIVGTKAIEDLGFIAQLVDAIPSKHLIIALDARGERIVTRGWTVETALNLADAIHTFDRYQPAAYLCTNVAVEGTMSGIDFKQIGRIVSCTETPIVYSGGISSLEDLRLLRIAGVSVAVVGMALYKGVFTVREAQEVVSDA